MPAVFVTLIFTLLLGVAVIGTGHKNFALWKFMVFGLPMMGFCLAFLFTKDRLRFLLLSAILALPFLGLNVPPASLGLTVFDILSIPAASVLLMTVIAGRYEIDFFPLHGAWGALLLILPSVATSIHFGNSIVSLVIIGELYLFFVILVHYLKDEAVCERIHLNLSLALIIACLFVFAEKATGVNFNFGAAHAGQFMQVQNLKVHRVAGIFQDPQKAAQFIAVFMTYLAILCGRGAFLKRSTLVLAWMAVILAVPALFITVSRAAIISGMMMTIIGILIFSRIGPVKRLYIGLCIALVVMTVSMAGPEMVLKTIFPQSVIKRFERSDKSMLGRIQIWENSLRIFKANPFTGVGPGNFQEYLMQENPRLRQFHERGGFVPDMPENGYLNILYEVGLIGSLGCLLLLGQLMVRVLAAVFAPKGERPASFMLAAGAGLLVFLATFITIFTISDMRNALILPFLGAAVISVVTSRPVAATVESKGTKNTDEDSSSLVPLC